MTSTLCRGELVLAIADAATRGTSDRWIHVMPAGTFEPRDGRQPFTLADPDAVIAASRAYAGPRQIPVDYEHQAQRAEKNGQPAPAAGWIDALQARKDGIWGRVRWTPRAAAYLAAREYRYFSPTFLHSADGTVRMIVGGGLTNNPALPQLLAVAREETPTMDPNADPGTPDAFLTELRKLLGLPDTADRAAVLANVRDLVAQSASAAAADLDPSKFVPIGTLEAMVAEVNRLNSGITAAEASRHVGEQIRAGNLPPALKDWGIALCSVNKIAFDAFVEKTRGGFNAIIDGTRLRTAGVGSVGSGRDLTSDERAVCERMGLTEEEFAKAQAFTASGRN